jgi:SNF2 family DNA or RNA helicase
MKKATLHVDEILFSDGSYEIKVKDKNKYFWVFVQLDDNGKILDGFCDCPKKKCSHLKIAFETIIKNKKPLHVLFKNSFWYQLLFVIGKKYEFKNVFDNVKTIKLPELCINFKNKKILKTFLEEIKKSHKENLSFFDLSEEEMRLLEEGRASEKIKYELSQFANIARYFFLLQYRNLIKKAAILLDKQSLPEKIKITFVDIVFESNFLPDILEAIIPFLSDMPIDLKVITTPSIAITYDAEKRKLHIKRKEEKEGIHIGPWVYVPKEGFYLQNIINKDVIEKEDIEKSLEKYASVISQCLENSVIYTHSIALKYFLFFDAQHDLHVKCYIVDKDDFDRKTSTWFGNWAYIEGRGFFYVRDIELGTKEMVFTKDDMASFVNLHRDFLNKFDGFKVHLSTLPSHICYELKKEGLKLEIKYDLAEGQIIDCGEWIYLEHEGFFPKRKEDILFHGELIEESKIEEFVSVHKEELREIKGFFVKKKIIKNVSLQIILNEKEQIDISPVIDLMEEYEKKEIKYFGDFVYVDKEGFCELPINFKLPQEYRFKQIIPSTKEDSFLRYELKRLKPFISFLDVRLKSGDVLQLILKKAFKEGNTYFFDLEYVSELGRVKLFKLWQAINRKKHFFFSDAGLILPRQFNFSFLKNFKRNNFSKTILKLSFLEAIRFLAFADIVYDCDEISQKVVEDILSFTEGKVALDEFNGTLRAYQEIGVKWLWFLYIHGLSGLLCDEMGLGKTQQAMALIAAIMHKDKNLKYIIVCPTSVMYHWQNLLAKFLPNSKVVFYHGVLRSLDSDFNILLTSYGVLRLSLEKIKAYDFELAVFDEIQIAKNFSSKVNSVLRQVRSKMKVGLTGTPIENHVREIKALFDVVLPNYLPHDNQFKQNFVIPIEKENDSDKKRILSKLISPFILRRRKQEVLSDLPEKMEEDIYCELSEEQAKLYRDEVIAYRSKIDEEIKTKMKPVYFHIFSLITRLKRLCDHPSLVLKDNSHHASGKWDLFVELLHEARESGQKVVVFSQYIEMLALIENYLRKENIYFASIKGSTKKREEEVKRFHEDPKCEVFVASLLAAGLGINLSCASVVIHYDRWWNPAKEDQATDRVHRIGQTRGVQVFKLIVKDSVEEHILKVIEKKRGLFSDMFREGTQPLSKEEMLEIFSKINEDVQKMQ